MCRQSLSIPRSISLYITSCHPGAVDHVPTDQMKESERELQIELRQDSDCHAGGGGASLKVVVAQRILDCRCLLGEGILYDPRTASVVWTDIYGKRLHQLLILEEETIKDERKTTIKAIHSEHALPKQLCSFGFLEETPSRGVVGYSPSSPLTFLCAWEDGFSVYDVEKEREITALSQGPSVRPNGGETRLNDGRVDPFGIHYVCGGFYGDSPDNYEQVFSVSQREEGGALSHSPILDGIQTTNSINWTMDGERMYLADSPAKTIWTYAYDPETSALSDKRVLCTYSKEETFNPDGSCVDSEGYLWNAVWSTGESSGMVHRIHPESGQVVLTVLLPEIVSQVSCCCFGGADLDILFITTACDGTDGASQPHAGALYGVKLPFHGRHESRLKFTFH
jgi:L-arabinonolactonase